MIGKMRSAAEKLEFKKKLEERTMVFAIAVFQALDSLPQVVSSRVISNQLGRAASSIGANYREANRAESADDFAHKISIALKECSETQYWFAIMSRLYPKRANFVELSDECDELLRIFQSIRRHVKK